MDSGRGACCGEERRRNVSDLFDRGLRCNRESPLTIEGDEQTDKDGLVARFSVAMNGTTLAAIRFRASTCITLVAYCELIRELMTGQDIKSAARLSLRDLIAELPDVPALKRDRALLAITAFRGALAAASITPNGEKHESRIHFRHAAP
jgi:NifU-like protein involved in Fe-S cluster formation